MAERTLLPVGDEGIDIDSILRGLRPWARGYSIDVDGGPVSIRLTKWSVDDGGTFVPSSGNVMIRFDVAGATLMPLRAIGAIRWAAPVNLAPLYLYSHGLGYASTRFEVAAFFSISGTQIEAPSNFDWQKHAIRHSGSYTVYRTTVASEQLAEVYRSLDSRFYLPYMDRRGTYWDVRVVPPPEDSGLGSSFDSALGALSRKAAIRSDIRPLALEWVCDSKVEFTFLLVRRQRCYRIELEFPTDDDMAGGRFLLPGDMVLIREPAQFAAGLVWMLYERSAVSSSLFGVECECTT
ncbi:hypothetical protein [Rhodococcus sp. UNC363MFTsu5.1]|uniref:hypothetical protein n=1 Tax=Rhodococcus sp. UNC363MFTsu5.1 TaxID=1449069 RepID=UPI00068CE5D2|nr:hypothetical protein [Rhodococcus sp. UNC363MFTsu5.1]